MEILVCEGHKHQTLHKEECCEGEDKPPEEVLLGSEEVLDRGAWGKYLGNRERMEAVCHDEDGCHERKEYLCTQFVKCRFVIISGDVSSKKHCSCNNECNENKYLCYCWTLSVCSCKFIKIWKLDCNKKREVKRKDDIHKCVPPFRHCVYEKYRKYADSENWLFQQRDEVCCVHRSIIIWNGTCRRFSVHSDYWLKLILR